MIELDVAKAEGSASITMESYAHGDTVPKLVITSETNSTTGATYTYAVNGSDEYTSTVPTDVGEYTVKAVLPESDNYNEVTVTADYTISHNYNKTSYDSEYHWNECSCGDKESSEAHTLSDWTITKKPTQTETGTAQRSCTGCGYSKQITLSSLSDTSVWQATECVEATEDSDGYIEYTSEYGTVIIILLFENEDDPSDEPDTDEYNITVSFSSEDGTDTVECNVKNNTNTDIQFDGILAIYDENGVLTRLELYAEYTLLAENTLVLDVDSAIYTGCTVRFFIWDSIESMKPYESAYVEDYQL